MSIDIYVNERKDFSEKNEVKKSESFENQTDQHLNEFNTEAVSVSAECIPYYKKFKSVQDWIDIIPVTEPSFKTNKNTGIKVISNIIVQKDTPVNQNHCNILETELKIKDKENTSPGDKSKSTESIILSTIYSNGSTIELDTLSLVDDLLEDPDYEPSSDEEKVCFALCTGCFRIMCM